MRAKRAVILIGATAATAGVAVGVRRAVRNGAIDVADPRTGGGEFAPVPAKAEHTVRSADGTALNVQEYGPAHAPTVVLVHGWTCSIDYWTPVLRGLSSDLRVIAYDLRGHGRSAAPGSAGFTTDALADDLAAVITAMVTEGAPAVVAGHSMGGMSLLALAARHPALLKQRVAAGVVASTGVANLVVGSGIQPGPEALRKVTASAGRAVLASTLPLGSRPTKATLPGIRYIALSKSATPEQVAFCAYIVMETPRHTRGGFGATLAALDLQVAVPHLDVPTVVIVGSSDRLTPPRHSRLLAEDLPRAELVQLDGIGHMTPVEAPDVVEKEIRRLVSEHATPVAAAAPAAVLDPAAAEPAVKVTPKPRRRRAAPAKPAEDAAPAEAAAPAAPTEVAAPSEPAAAAAPAKVAAPPAPAAKVEPAEAATPATPVEAAAPAAPASPSAPVKAAAVTPPAPVKPTTVTSPAPVKPAAVVKPTETAKPSAPVASTPVSPPTAVKPAAVVKPTEKVKPPAPVKPAAAVTPSTPAKPATVTPSAAVKPAAVVEPTEKVKPAPAAKTTPPAKTTLPATTTKPARPAAAVKPPAVRVTTAKPAAAAKPPAARDATAKPPAPAKRAAAPAPTAEPAKTAKPPAKKNASPPARKAPPKAKPLFSDNGSTPDQS